MEANHSSPEVENTAATTTSPQPALCTKSVDRLAARLSEFDDLYFPRAVQSSAVTAAQRQSLLCDLCSRDAAVFLERYGSKLTSSELEEFDKLKGDYEINWHLNQLRSLLSPTKEELKSRSTTTKNRRRAYMDKLVSDGQYFSEDAMRERDPYLHYELLGKFQDPSGRLMARPGERWSDTLMRQCEEAVLVQKIRSEQQLRGVPEEEWVGSERLQVESQDQQMEVESEEEEEEEEEEDEEEEEEEEDEDEDEEEESTQAETGDVKIRVTGDSQTPDAEELPDAAPSDQQTTAEEPSLKFETLSLDDMQDRMDQFTSIMQQKFLSGEDQQHVDYSKIDGDVSLDDHWIREVNVDAEEKYFDDV